MKKRMKKRKELKTLGLALLLFVGLMGSLTACGSKESEEDVKEKIDKANEKVAELEEEDEKDQEFVFREEETGAILTKYNGTAEEVEIPEDYNGLAVVKIESDTFKNNETVKAIQIPRTVTTIQSGTLQDECGIVIRGYANTYAEYYAMSLGLTFESVGENTFQADSITIWDKEGAHCTNIYRGQIIDDEELAGVTFKKVDGKSVLLLDNCDIGSIEVEEFAALTIELAAGSDNKITGGRGKEGIWTHGNLTVKGDGKLSVFGGDYYRAENTGSSIGYGIIVEGNLSIEENAKVYAKAGDGKKVRNGIGVNVSGGNLTVSDGGMLEAVSGESEEAAAAAGLLVQNFVERGGEIVLENVNVTGGGAIVPFVYRWTDEETGQTQEEIGGQSISGVSEVTWVEEQGFVGASTHIIIGQ